MSLVTTAATVSLLIVVYTGASIFITTNAIHSTSVGELPLVLE